jgi:hypothetical protein
MGGLANRMRVIDSAVNFCELNNYKLRIYWIKDPGLNCDFKEIWEPLDCVKDTTDQFATIFFYLFRFPIIRYLFTLPQKFGLIKLLVDQFTDKVEEIYDFFKVLKKKKFKLLFIVTCEGFFPSIKFRSNLFKILPSIEDLVRKETEQFTDHTIGIHIRRNDNIQSIYNSPIELFEKALTEELLNNPYTTFYVTSDDPTTKKRLQEKYKEIIFSPVGILERNSKEGIIQSVVELYALSRTKNIFGSYWSSFSSMAALIEDKEILIVKN